MTEGGRAWGRSRVFVALKCCQFRKNHRKHGVRGELPGYRLSAQSFSNETPQEVLRVDTHTQGMRRVAICSHRPAAPPQPVLRAAPHLSISGTQTRFLPRPHAPQQIFDCLRNVVSQYYFTVTFNHDNQKALELRTEDVKDCDEWVAAITQARYTLTRNLSPYRRALEEILTC